MDVPRAGNLFGTQVGFYGLDLSIGPLYYFAFGAIAFYGIMLGGWSSGSKYSFLGSMRAAAQLISYEVSQSLALVGVFSSHLVLVSSVMAAAVVLAHVAMAGDRRAYARSLASALGLAAVATLVLSAYWTVPLLIGRGPEAAVIAATGAAGRLCSAHRGRRGLFLGLAG